MTQEPSVTIEGPKEINVADRPTPTGAVTAEQLSQAIKRFPKDRVFISQPAVHDPDNQEADK